MQEMVRLLGIVGRLVLFFYFYLKNLLFLKHIFLKQKQNKHYFLFIKNKFFSKIFFEQIFKTT